MKSMILTSMTIGSIGTNCYLLYDETTKDASVIDPSDDAAAVASRIEKLGLKVRAILLTHGHFDHGGDVERIRKLTGAPVYLHPADRGLGLGISRLGVTEDLADEMVLRLIGTEFRVLHTPGHTPGSVCFLVGDVLFSGDTLFADSCGRTDLPGGNGDQLLCSLRRLAELPGDYHVYPGHEEATSLEYERQNNFYMTQARNR